MRKKGRAAETKLIAPGGSTSNCKGARDAGMHRPKAGKSSHWGMKARTGVVRAAVRATANVDDTRQELDKAEPAGDLVDPIERAQSLIPAKVEYLLRAIKRSFSYVKARDRGLAKNVAQLHTLSALSSLRMALNRVIRAVECVRPRGTKPTCNATPGANRRCAVQQISRTWARRHHCGELCNNRKPRSFILKTIPRVEG